VGIKQGRKVEKNMNVGDSVRKCIDDWESRELEAAMLHACNAVDGTAKKVYPKLGNKDRFTRLLRENYEILGPMGCPGTDLIRTRFPVPVPKPTASGGKPDIADIIYCIHRCSHGHGDELPQGFALLHDAAGPKRINRLTIRHGEVQLSDRIIFALLAVAVLCPSNIGQSVPEGYYLEYGDTAKLVINEWWGRASDFAEIVAQDPVPKLTLDFGDWMQ
jgi:hypothetical protein